MNFSRSDFPKGFTFGAATSAYQIEGHSFGGAGPTHWDTFAATPGNVVRAEHGAIACDHYHRFEEDLDLVANGGFDAYRFSTSWARVMPDGVTPNPEGLDFYDRLTDAMLERGIKPCATLYHWELPSALADKGGWQNPDIAKWFGDFTQTIMGRIGDRMHSVAPINEPWCVGWLSHFMGGHAPGLRDIRATARAMHHILVAHGTAIQTMRGMGMSGLGGVFNLEWAMPETDTVADQTGADLSDGYYNRFFLGGVFKGEYPENILAGLAPHLPENWQDDFPLIQSPLDWCGINYYTRRLVRSNDGPWPGHEYTGDLPLYVTENGMANADVITNGAVDDENRISFLNAHFEAARYAIEQGVPLEGYFVWSLLDNYEWTLGYEKRFGLIHVDFDTLQRTPKRSYYALKSALESS